MDMQSFPVIVEEDEHGFVVDCPSFQGCYTQGDTYEEAMENIRDLIRLHLERNSPATMKVVGVASVEIEG
jgi:predicted RNase H-like HicB family nuclease